MYIDVRRHWILTEMNGKLVKKAALVNVVDEWACF